MTRPRLSVCCLLFAFNLAAAEVSAAASPLCPSLHQIDTIKELKRTSPHLTPAQIALQTRYSEAAVVHAMDVDSRIPVDTRHFAALWNDLRIWEEVLLVAFSSGSEFAMRGPLPDGETDIGYFDFDEPGSSYGGRLKRGRFGIIYLLTTKGETGPAHQIAVFDKEGKRVFAVFVPRNDTGELLQQPYQEFLRLNDKYSGRSLGCDAEQVSGETPHGLGRHTLS